MPTVFDIDKGEFVEIDAAKKKGVIDLADSTTALVKGDKGDKGDKGESVRGEPGIDGKDGKDGKDAAPGKDGRGIASITQPAPGKALVTYTDGKSQSITLPAGANGREVEMGKSSTHIQWRYKGDAKWLDLILIPKARGRTGGGGGASLDDLTGILVAGTNITLTPSAAGKLSIAASAGGVTSVSNSDGTLTISPTTGAVVASIPTNRNMYFGSVAATLPGTITRSGNYISSVALTGKTITITRSGNYISSITDAVKTWTFTRNGSNQITSWSVA